MNRRAIGLSALVAFPLALVGALAPSASGAQQLTGPFFGQVPSPNASSLNNTLFAASAVSGNDVWAVGDFNPGHVPTVSGRQTLTEHWNGSNWTVIPSPDYTNGNHVVASHLQGVDAMAADNVWAVGYAEDFTAGVELTLIEHWNGTAWSIVPSPSPGGGRNTKVDRLLAVDGIAANDIWAVGQTTFQTSLIEHWNGSTWRVVSSPCKQPQTGVVQISATDAWSVSTLNSCHFDGASWHAVPIAVPPRSEPFLFAVAASAPNDVWAVGEADINTPSGTFALPLVEHWTGLAWTANTNVPARTLHGVDVLAANNIYAAGDDEAVRPTVIHWDGHTWSLVATPKPQAYGTLYAAEAISAADIWGVGSFFPDINSGTKERTITVHAPTTQGAISGISSTPLSTITWVGPVKGSTTTDKAGRYAVGGLPPGRYAVVNSYSGCSSDAASETVAAGAVTTHDFHICG